MLATGRLRTLRTVSLMLVGYLAIQSVMVVAHEYTHSGTAWLLGYIRTPDVVVWGNPITIQGWDEGVPYDQLFPSPGHGAEAAIGGMPLLLHTVLALVGIRLLLVRTMRRRRVAFLAIFALVVSNLAELIAYIFMRPFIHTGDTGRFNEGTGLSPWFLFLGGSVFLLAMLWVLARRIGPELNGIVASRAAARAILWCAAFVLFLWASGLRFVALYPDPLWRTGLIGVAGFLMWGAFANAVLNRG